MIDVLDVDATLGKARYRLTEEPGGHLKITRYAIDNTITGTFYVPRALLVAYARKLIADKLTELFQ